jgi:acetolactate synthase-1/2/3 large subunit
VRTGGGAVTGGSAIVQALLDHSVEVVFGLPGAQIYGLFDAFARAKPALRTIGARHEQGVAYMAYGYARASGRPGVYAVVPGPGMLNTAAALLTAFGANAPVLCLTGQVPSQYLGRERGQLHELRDHLGVLRALTKWADRIEHPTQTPLLVARAFQEMMSGRQGPAALEAPWDFFTRSAKVRREPPLSPFPHPEPDSDLIADAARVLAQAKAPMIFVGGGALGASEAITELAQTLAAPVVSFRAGRGVVSDAHPMSLTVVSGARLWRQCDVAVALGTRLEVPEMRWHHRPDGLQLIRIDIDAAEMRRLPADIGIVTDAEAGARALLMELNLHRIRPSTRWREQIAEAKRSAEAATELIQPQVDYLRAIRDVLPADGFFVDELSQVGFASWFAFPVYRPRTFISAGYQGTLGFGFPTALGVKTAFPEKAVLSITGDGGFMFSVQELATAVQYGINLVTVVFNNESYGNVRRDQKEVFSGRLIGADLLNPDFVKLAESFGVSARRVTSPDGLRPALEDALGASAPRLIEVRTPRGSEASPWGLLHPRIT